MHKQIIKDYFYTKNTAMRKLANFLFLTTLVCAFSLQSCKKKCDLGPNLNEGEIREEYSVFPTKGYITSDMETGLYLVTDTTYFGNDFLVSTDKGVTKTAVNFNTHSLLAFPITSNCFASFQRKVTIDQLNKVVVYTIMVKDCGTCDTKVFTENWVVIPAVDQTYTVLYDVKQQTIY